MKTTIFFVWLALLTAGFLSQCKKQEESPKEKAPAPPPVAKGQILERVGYASNPGQTFAVYLPAQYSANRQWPVLYFFDAHARGALPIKRYRTLADEFGFILIGSNNLKNGLPLPEIDRRASELLTETAERFNLHPLRKYIMGFSGGARVAVLTALMRNDIAGVIGCGAGFPQWNRPITHPFEYIMIAGKGDFNYLELKRLNDQLKQSPLPHWFIAFNGKHEWPPVKTVRKACAVLQLSAMRDGLIPIDTHFVKQFLDSEKPILDSLKQTHALLSLANEYTLYINALQGLADTHILKAQLQNLLSSGAYLRRQKAEETRTAAEIKQQKEMQQAFARQDARWLENKFRRLNKTGPQTPNYWQNKRLLAFMSLMGYLYTEQALKQNNTHAAQTYLKIYHLTDAHNADFYYLQAWLDILSNKLPQAQQAAEKALQLGLDDPNKLFANPVFSVLRLHKR